MIGHPDERRLLAFHEGQLADRQRQRIAAHLAACQQCRNVIQGHRAIRAVFRLEASPAPGGVLERALATRAAGGVMVLPVVDPDPGTRPRTGLIAVIAGAAAVLLLGVFQVVPLPVRSITGAWDWWSRTIAEWRPFASSGGIEIPEMFRAPVAKPAVVHPGRLRPMTVMYRNINRRGNGETPRVDTSGFSVVAPDGEQETWRLRTFRGSDPGDYRETTLNSASLEPWQWTRSYGQGDVWKRTVVHRLERDTLFESLSYAGNPPPRFVETQPPGVTVTVIDSPHDAPVVSGSDHWAAVMTTVELSPDWAASFAYMYGNVSPGRLRLAETTYYVAGLDTVLTPAGRFEAWRVRGVEQYGESPMQWWLRTSDGLMVKSGYRITTEWADSEELLSVTYP